MMGSGLFMLRAGRAISVALVFGAMAACRDDASDGIATPTLAPDATPPDAARPSNPVVDAAQPEVPRETDAARAEPSARGDAQAVNSDSGSRVDAASSALEGTAGDASTSCSLSLDIAVGEHACLHVLHGPFAALSAAPETPVGSLDRTHTVYSVPLPDSSSVGVLKLRVAQDALYAVFKSADLSLRLTYLGEELPIVHSQRVLELCEGVSHVALWDLDANREYQLWVGPGALSVDLILEQIVPGSLNEVCSAETDASPPIVREPTREAGVFDAALESVAPDASPNDSGGCTDDAGLCLDTCAPLGSACLAGGECCSGRCFARECVPLECRTEGHCERDEECCLYCHQTETSHCH